MKVCKKCKKHVANKSKICKYCGADVSKAKIIKNQTKKSNTSKKKEIEKKIENKVEKKDIVKTEEEKKLEKKKLDLKEKELEEQEKTGVLTPVEIPEVLKPEEKEEKKDNKLSKILKDLKIKFEKVRTERIIKKANKPVKEKKKKEKIKVEKSKKKENKTKDVSKKTKIESIPKVDKVKLEDTVEILKDKTVKFKETNKEIRKKIKDKTKKAIQDGKEKVAKSPAATNRKVRIIAKIIIILGLIFLIAGISLYFSNGMTTQEITSIKGTPATNDKLFSVGDVINYKGVNYKVANVKLSEGNGYSVPRDGNVFLIVTIYIMNNTNKPIDYGYTSWVMTDDDEIKARKIFSSINVDDALYSGKLSPGATKRGSIIFEEAKDAKKVRLSFYELEINQNKEEVVNTDKKAFSVSIDIPKQEEEKK